VMPGAQHAQQGDLGAAPGSGSRGDGISQPRGLGARAEAATRRTLPLADLQQQLLRGCPQGPGASTFGLQALRAGRAGGQATHPSTTDSTLYREYHSVDSGPAPSGGASTLLSTCRMMEFCSLQASGGGGVEGIGRR
jgi:hypothetical protein